MYIKLLATLTINAIPDAESDEWEFKRSATKPSELAKKLGCAASGLANSGGGIFVVGVDDVGDPDDGIEKTIGRQDLRDWVDQAINRVEPTPKYDVKLLDDNNGRGTTVSYTHLTLPTKA